LRKKLTKASRFLFFDLGVRRAAAGEGHKLSIPRLGELFEHYIGLELLRYIHLDSAYSQLRFWRDPDGPEVDWVIDREKEYIPIEVKWTQTPRESDARHLRLFLEEYREARQGYIVCRTPRPFKLARNITCIPWQELYKRLFCDR
jgi:predicted AAA+ superfamily ATPase